MKRSRRSPAAAAVAASAPPTPAILNHLLGADVGAIVAAAEASFKLSALTSQLKSLTAAVQARVLATSEEMADLVQLRGHVKVQNAQDVRNNECSADYCATFLVGPNSVVVRVNSAIRNVEGDEDVSCESDMWNMSGGAWDVDMIEARSILSSSGIKRFFSHDSDTVYKVPSAADASDACVRAFVIAFADVVHDAFSAADCDVDLGLGWTVADVQDAIVVSSEEDASDADTFETSSSSEG